ncbi:PAS domain-containing protein [Pontibacter sp. KCTC 32443]|uniref:sensor histidine kinase n=1 Tax=Pontibacter TaxID=323449 RepID=UPI00164EC5DD|nr:MULTISPECIES: PAS domain-containing protein [Pontibacter]MBC5772730.1 PAS domain-containing protein [Pontibacter sp. KCTC 32443]
MSTATLPTEFLKVFEQVPDSYLILSPELTVLTASDAYLAATYTLRDELKDKSIFAAFPDNVQTSQANADMVASLQKVLLTKKPHRISVNQYSPFGTKTPPRAKTNSFSCLNTPVLDAQGEVLYIIHKIETNNLDVRQAQSIAPEQLIDQEKEHNTLESQQQGTEEESINRHFLQATLDSSPDMIQVFKAVRNADNKIIDFTWELNNQKSFEMYGDVIGKSLLTLNPGVKETGIFGKLVKVTETGQPLQYDQHYNFEQFDGWFHQSVVKLNDGVVTITSEITERKNTEIALRDSMLFIEQIMAATPDFIMLFNLLTNKLDFVNRRPYQENEERYQETLAISYDQILARAHPDDRNSLHCFIEKFRTAANDEIHTLDYRVVDKNKVIWYRTRGKVFNRDKNGKPTHYISIVQDITKYKLAEQELTKQYHVLKQAEEVACMGSWEYNVITRKLTWSDGMYRMFNLPAGSPINLNTYLAFTLPEDLPLVKKIIRQILKSQEPLENVFRVTVKEKVHTIRIKTLPLRNTFGETEKVLGIDLDITEVKQLAQENLEIRLNQQKNLLLAIMDAQEEERRRISEALHNGVGQVLYAAKINLDRLRGQSISNAPDIAANFLQVDKILQTAISQTRSLSHELTPVVLEQFGLITAFHEIGVSLSSPFLHINCQVLSLPDKLEKYLQIVVYRIAQELANNIVKHSKATEAQLLLRKQADKLVLLAEDNGEGFNAEHVDSQGIGLSSIKNRVNLLNGSFKITASPGKGTLIEIRLPLHAEAGPSV